MDNPLTPQKEGFGLMLYNARYYDPALGRFASADSVLDNPVSGWDRFAYVKNNPIRYIDPSGNLCIGEERSACNHGANFSVQPKPGQNNPDEVNMGALTEKGRRLYEYYRRMYANHEGWWWKRYGNNGFTVWEFMAIQWGYEQSLYPNTSLYSTAVANAAASFCSGYSGCDMKTVEWNLNFLSEYSHRPFSKVQACIGDSKCDIRSVSDEPPLGEGMKTVHAIYNRVTLAEKPLDYYHDPMSVGNVSLSPKILAKMIRYGMVYESWGEGDTFFIMTQCQDDYYQAALSSGKGASEIRYGTYSCGG